MHPRLLRRRPLAIAFNGLRIMPAQSARTLLLALLTLAWPTQAQTTATAPTTAPASITLQGSLLCFGACLPAPKPDDHRMVLYAIDGTPQIRATIDELMSDWPDAGLDASAAEKLMNQFTARLTFFLSPQSPALRDAAAPASQKTNHYCPPAQAVAITGETFEKDGVRWITARKIEPAKLVYPRKMLSPDRPFATSDRPPLLLKVGPRLTLKCIAIPPGKFLMGTPFYMWPYYQEEYPHIVTLTRPFYLADIPVTQEMYEAVMDGENPSTAKDPQLPVQDPHFADIERFCRILSQQNNRTVRLPTDAEWEYAARVGTSNPPFPRKYADQNSSGPDGFKSPLKVKSREPNAWGLYDMASCWWEITADRGMYNARHAETDPRYAPPPHEAPGAQRVQRSGRGIVKDTWSLATHEFITEKGYAGQKFRVLVDADDAPPATTQPARTR
jgi:hypothetical protein